MIWLGPILIILAGILAASGFIISKAANAKSLIDKVVPFQGFLGVIVLAWGIREAIWLLGHLDWIGHASTNAPIFAIDWYAFVAAELVLGFLLGMPLIAKWIPGESAAEVRAMEMQKKVAGFSSLIGLIGIGVAVLRMYYIHKYHVAY